MIKFALRNVLRNKKRSLLTVLSIFTAAMIVGVAQGWVKGIFNLFTGSYIKYTTGNVRIVTEEYSKRERFSPVSEVIYDADGLISKIKNIDGVTSVEKRIRFGILLGKGGRTVRAMGVGTDLSNNSFNLKEKIKKGALEKGGLYLGKGLAEKLAVTVGEELLIAAKTSEGGLNAVKLEVKGIFSFGIGAYDKKYFFMSHKDACRLLKIYDGTTEIYVFTENLDMSDSVKGKISSFAGPGLKVESFKDLMGGMYQTFETSRIVYLFVEALILFLASFVIINTMMMSIYERVREIGTLKAMGMTDRELFLNFSLEGAILGAAGGTAGALCGYLIIVVLSKTGVNLKAMFQSMDVPVEYIFRPELSIWAPLAAVLLSIIIPALASMIPARHVKRFTPSEALRK